MSEVFQQFVWAQMVDSLNVISPFVQKLFLLIATDIFRKSSNLGKCLPERCSQVRASFWLNAHYFPFNRHIWLAFIFTKETLLIFLLWLSH